MNRKQRRQAASGRLSRPGEARGPILAAVEHHRAGRLDKAATLYRRALKQRPEDAEALHLLGVLLHQQGKHDQALRCLEKAVRLDDRAAAYHFNYGEVLRALGRAEEASRRYRQALALEPANADAHFALGTALLEAGEPGAAVQSIRRALELRPDDVEAWLNLGAALLDAGDNEGAIEAFRRALGLAPAYAEAHVNLGGALRESGDLEGAIASFERAIEVAPGLADAHFGLGMALAERSDWQGAATAYREAAACDPKHARAYLNLGKALENQGRLDEAGAALRDALDAAPDDPIMRLALGNLAQRRGELDEAVACFEAAAELDPRFAVAFLNLGNARLDKGQPEAAIESYRRALAIDPDNAQSHFNLGVALQSQGAFEAAIEALERALDLKPDFAEALAGIAVSKSYREGDPEIARIEELLADDDLPAASRINLGFTLGKIHDDLGRYDEAFARFRAANALKNAELGFDGAGHAAFLSRIRDTFDGDFLAARRGWGTPSELPVLVLGMPRSGTTLVEQILASHPEVFGAGELRKLHYIVDGLPSRLGGGSAYPECAALIDAAGAEALGQEYLEALREHSAEAVRITDKMPQNFLRLGLVALILPAARIIHCRRDPLDTCLSCYFQHFGSPYEFAYDLESLGTYYRHYEGLMAHWAEVLPNAATHPMLELQYEDLIADQEGVSREIVAFCGLEWDRRCLAFHESRRPVRTASQWQVRQPLYASSVGRWRHYDKHLAPLKAALAAKST